MGELFNVNLSYLSGEVKETLLNTEAIGDFELTKTGHPNIKINNIYFHSNHDPIKEAERFLQGLKQESTEKLYIFFGNGLGYSIRKALENPKITVIWMEPYPFLLKKALELFDYSSYLKENRLRILTPPYHEEKLYTVFKGLGTFSTSFLPHRPSFQWQPEAYSECKYICEKFFQKKDVNIATLSKFETIWTKNILENLPELLYFKPVSLLFGIATGIPIMVTGAGPSLYNDIENIKKFRDLFLLIAVDTSLHILDHFNITPDLIYSVDPQPINRSYLEGYNGEGILVFDPTSTYHTLRMDSQFTKGFYPSSPFPLFKLFSKHLSIEAGDIPYGGSVSTNAVSLAEFMGASKVLILGQDLAFTDGFAHCKGAILEERLNYKESRKFRRELHNYRQLFALKKLTIAGYNGETYHTNEKMQIFRKWFEDNSKNKNWINLTSRGGIISNIPRMSIEEFFTNPHEGLKEKVASVREKIKDLVNSQEDYFSKDSFKKETINIIQSLKDFEKVLEKGEILAKKIYQKVKIKAQNTKEFSSLLQEIDSIDDLVSQKKGLNEIVGLGVQRVILTITEGYDTLLSLEEKKNKDLGIAKKSVLLYEGLFKTTKLIRRLLQKALLRIGEKDGL
jgi:hypothetical protein